MKLDELFVHWLSLPHTATLIQRMVDDAKVGKALPMPSLTMYVPVCSAPAACPPPSFHLVLTPARAHVLA